MGFHCHALFWFEHFLTVLFLKTSRLYFFIRLCHGYGYGLLSLLPISSNSVSQRLNNNILLTSNGEVNAGDLDLILLMLII